MGERSQARPSSSLCPPMCLVTPLQLRSVLPRRRGGELGPACAFPGGFSRVLRPPPEQLGAAGGADNAVGPTPERGRGSGYGGGALLAALTPSADPVPGGTGARGGSFPSQFFPFCKTTSDRDRNRRRAEGRGRGVGTGSGKQILPENPRSDFRAAPPSRIWVPSSSLRKCWCECGGRDEPGHGGGGTPVSLCPRRAAPGTRMPPNTDVRLFPELLNVP